MKQQLDYFPEADAGSFDKAKVVYANHYKIHQKRRLVRRRRKLLIGASIASFSIVSMSILALFHGKRSPSASNIPPEVAAVETAREQMIRDHDIYIEKLNRFDRGVLAYTDKPGLKQQLRSNIAAQKADAIALQIKDPRHPAYRKHESVAWLYADVNANEKALLGSMGVGAILEYNRLDGTKVREEVSPDGLMFLGLEAADTNNLAQSLTTRPIYDKNAILTEFGQVQHPLKLSRANFLAAQGLVDPAAELQSINSFQGRLP